MNNADMPAMPMDVERADYAQQCRPFRGLTKREYIAAMAMQGMLSDLTASEQEGYDVSRECVASHALAMADALLKELEK